jgi:hypothetical protein
MFYSSRWKPVTLLLRIQSHRPTITSLLSFCGASIFRTHGVKVSFPTHTLLFTLGSVPRGPWASLGRQGVDRCRTDPGPSHVIFHTTGLKSYTTPPWGQFSYSGLFHGAPGWASDARGWSGTLSCFHFLVENPRLVVLEQLLYTLLFVMNRWSES